MKCATVFVLIFVASISQTLAVLRPLFPAKPSPPFSGEVINITDDSIRLSAGQLSQSTPR